VDPGPDPVLLRKLGSAGNRTRTSASVARNSGHLTTGLKIILITWCTVIFCSVDFLLSSKPLNIRRRLKRQWPSDLKDQREEED
jgi:hypothetical protein